MMRTPFCAAAAASVLSRPSSASARSTSSSLSSASAVRSEGDEEDARMRSAMRGASCSRMRSVQLM